MFRLQFAQYGLLHSRFLLFVSKVPQAAQFFFVHILSFPATYFSCACRNTIDSWNFYCTTRTGFEHGKRAWRDWHTITTRLFAFVCHVTTTTFITSFAHVPFCHCTCYIYDHMLMTCYVIIKLVNSFSVWTCPSNIMSSQFKHENTKILYSLKYSWSRVSSLIPPPRCKLMTVVSSNRWTTGTIFRPSRYDL